MLGDDVMQGNVYHDREPMEDDERQIGDNDDVIYLPTQDSLSDDESFLYQDDSYSSGDDENVEQVPRLELQPSSHEDADDEDSGETEYDDQITEEETSDDGDKKQGNKDKSKVNNGSEGGGDGDPEKPKTLRTKGYNKLPAMNLTPSRFTNKGTKPSKVNANKKTARR